MTGYQKLADIMTKHAQVATFQRFDFLNTLNILYLQAELVRLEHDLRENVRDDIESGNYPPSEYPDDGESLNEAESEDIEFGEIEDISGEGDVKEKALELQFDRNSITKAASSGWWYLSNMDNRRTWEMMLKAREKLKEYS